MGELFEGLGINIPNLIAQIVSFGALFGLLYIVAYKPILRMLDARSQKVKESMEQAEQVKAQAASAEDELKKQIEAGRKEGQEIVNRARLSGEELVQKAQEQAKAESVAILARAQADISRERDQAITVLRQEFADLTIDAAEKVIDRSLDKAAHRQLIEKILTDSQPKQG